MCECVLLVCECATNHNLLCGARFHGHCHSICALCSFFFWARNPAAHAVCAVLCCAVVYAGLDTSMLNLHRAEADCDLLKAVTDRMLEQTYGKGGGLLQVVVVLCVASRWRC